MGGREVSLKGLQAIPAPPNYPLRDPIYQLIETIRPLIEVHWGSRFLYRFWSSVRLAKKLGEGVGRGRGWDGAPDSMMHAADGKILHDLTCMVLP